MKKLKDTFLLLFWGLIAGAFFVGCILGFGYCVNHVGPLLEKMGLPSGLVLVGLAGVITGTVSLIAWIWTKTHKGYWETADQIFPQEVRFKLRSNPLAKAILDGNDWKIMQLMGKNRANWTSLSNQMVANGLTPLHLAVGVENKSACETLLYFKADPLHPDAQGKIPIDYARVTRNQAIIKLLEKYAKK